MFRSLGLNADPYSAGIGQRLSCSAELSLLGEGWASVPYVNSITPQGDVAFVSVSGVSVPWVVAVAWLGPTWEIDGSAGRRVIGSGRGCHGAVALETTEPDRLAVVGVDRTNQ